MILDLVKKKNPSIADGTKLFIQCYCEQLHKIGIKPGSPGEKVMVQCLADAAALYINKIRSK